MNKLRVFQNVKYKRAVTGFSIQNLGTVLLIILFLPYIVTFLFGNLWQEDEGNNQMLEEQLRSGRYQVVNQTAVGRETIPLELYVADLLARTMQGAYEKEALKAQAILLRTNLLQKGETEISVNDAGYGKEPISKDCFMATAETKGMYLVYEKKPVYAAYFKVSNGFTRNAGQVLMSTEYPYLKSVNCDKDFLSEEYTDVKTFSVYEFEKRWENLPAVEVELKEEVQVPSFVNELNIQYLRDDAGYVQFMNYQGKWVTGENFRYEFELSSSDFQIQLQKDELIFTTKGCGHGIGMSQFAANEMAKEGKSYQELLSYFFENTSLTRQSSE